jgi:hypothetical protein
MRRWAPIAIVLFAGAAQATGAPVIAFYVLLLAVPALAACALSLLGELLDARAAGPVEPVTALEPLLAGLALLIVVWGTAANTIAITLSGCLAVYAVQVALRLGVELRTPAPRARLEG